MTDTPQQAVVNAEWVRKLKRTYGLINSQIAAICLCSENLVEAWLSPPESPRHRDMLPRYQKLLEDGIRRMKQ